MFTVPGPPDLLFCGVWFQTHLLQLINFFRSLRKAGSDVSELDKGAEHHVRCRLELNSAGKQICRRRVGEHWHTMTQISQQEWFWPGSHKWMCECFCRSVQMWELTNHFPARNMRTSFTVRTLLVWSYASFTEIWTMLLISFHYLPEVLIVIVMNHIIISFFWACCGYWTACFIANRAYLVLFKWI